VGALKTTTKLCRAMEWGNKEEEGCSPPSMPKEGAASVPFEPITLIIIDDQGQGDAEYGESIPKEMLKDLLKYRVDRRRGDQRFVNKVFETATKWEITKMDCLR
jgi:hypothetical protein